MKLLYLNHNVVGTGTYLRALHLGQALVRRGHEVSLVTTSRDRRMTFVEREDGGVRVLEAPDLWAGVARTGWDPWNALRRWLRLRDSVPDVVHAFDGRPVVSLPGWLLTTARGQGPALVMDWADWWGRGGQIQQRSGWAVRTFFGPIETWFEEAFRPGAAGHTVISMRLRERAIGLGLPPERVLVLPNGCEPGAVAQVERGEARRALGVPPDAPVVVHLGVLTAADMQLLAGAVRHLRLHIPAARLVLVGRHGAPVPPDLLDDGAVHATGFVDGATKDCWLGAADACVAALTDTIGSRGRWPSKVNDYFSAGRATVMTAVSDAADLVRDRGLGWTAPADPASLGVALVTALSSPGAAAEAGARARSLAEGPLSWDSLAVHAEELYGKVRTPTAVTAVTEAAGGEMRA